MKEKKLYILVAELADGSYHRVPIETYDAANDQFDREVNGRTFLSTIDTVTTYANNDQELTEFLMKEQMIERNLDVKSYKIIYLKNKEVKELHLLYKKDIKFVNCLKNDDSSSANIKGVKVLVNDLIHNVCCNKDLNYYDEETYKNVNILSSYLVNNKFLARNYKSKNKTPIVKRLELIAHCKEVLLNPDISFGEINQLIETQRVVKLSITNEIASSYKLARGIYVGLEDFSQTYPNYKVSNQLKSVEMSINHNLVDCFHDEDPFLGPSRPNDYVDDNDLGMNR